MDVNLTPQLEELRSKVSSGLYTSASEVVREALRLMDEHDRFKQAKLDELRRDVRRGLDSGASEQWDAAAVKTKARARRVARPAVASMARVTRRPQAEADILEIWAYIAEDSMVEADRWVDRLDQNSPRGPRNP